MKKIVVVWACIGMGMGSAFGQTNILPVAYAGKDQIKMDVDGNGEEHFVLDASESKDEDGSLLSFEWTDASGTVIATSAALTRVVGIGNEKLKLTVTDDMGGAAIDYIELFVGEPSNYGNHRIAIRGGRQEIFVNGINLAWDDFAQDIVNYDEAYFTSVFEKLASYGANGLRWWLHTNGSMSPEFDDNGLVKKISPNELRNMRKALDKAYEHGIVISMCLFSFDLLQNQRQDKAQMKRLLEDAQVRQSYIDNALIPIIKALGDHPAVMAWEIFNEPEGMTTTYGWSAERTTMQHVQQFINHAAAAIHDHSSEALVTNGSWSFKTASDVEDYFNYYKDDRLIAAGGKSNGHLDFYQIHYYPAHFGNAYSPFHRPASHWGLDKPIVIGEFPVSALDGKADPHYSTTDCYQLAFELGYAGVMAWSYTGFEGGDIESAREGLDLIASNYPSEVFIGADPHFSLAPTVSGTIPSLRAYTDNGDGFPGYFDLNDIFSDPEGGTLTYSVYDISNQDLVEIKFDQGLISVYPFSEVSGSAEVILSATDEKGANEWVRFNVSLRPFTGNLAMFKNIEASSEEEERGIARSAELANDGDVNTRWSSNYTDGQWLMIDLGEEKNMNEARLFWEDAYATAYTIETSADKINWSVVYSASEGDGGWDFITFDRHRAQYIRVTGASRATSWGVSLWEVEVYDNLALAVDSRSKVVIYPNPTQGYIHIESPKPVRKAEIVDAQGQVVLTQFGDQVDNVDLTGLEFGIYMLSLQTDQSVENYKILKTGQ